MPDQDRQCPVLNPNHLANEEHWQERRETTPNEINAAGRGPNSAWRS